MRKILSLFLLLTTAACQTSDDVNTSNQPEVADERGPEPIFSKAYETCLKEKIAIKTLSDEDFEECSKLLPPKKEEATSCFGLRPVEVNTVILTHIGEIRECYSEELKAGNDAKGQVDTSFVIDKDGHIKNLVMVKNEIGTAFGVCVSQVLEEMRFPKPCDGKDVKVNYPFKFSQT